MQAGVSEHNTCKHVMAKISATKPYGHGKIMKKIINGKTYNTDTATNLGSVQHNGILCEDEDEYLMLGTGELYADDDYCVKKGVCTSTLYLTIGGAYFIFRDIADDHFACPDDIGTPTKELADPGIHPISRHQAILWAERLFTADQVENMFGPLPEAAAKGESLYVRLPAHLKRKVESSAKSAGQSTNVWVLRCLEQGIKNAGGDPSEEANDRDTRGSVE